MKTPCLLEEDQWIPWEISYSLKEHTLGERTSLSNAVLAVLIPDERISYEYLIKEDTYPNCHRRILSTSTLFKIFSNNMFNIKKPILNN